MDRLTREIAHRTVQWDARGTPSQPQFRRDERLRQEEAELRRREQEFAQRLNETLT